MTNRDRLEALFRTVKIAVERGTVFHRHLPPKPAAFDFDRTEGMLLGVAVGDGLGITTEGRLPGERSAAHGRIRDYLPNKYVGDRRGYPSDDTQLTFWTLEQMILDRGFVPERVAARLARGRIFGIAPFSTFLPPDTGEDAAVDCLNGTSRQTA
jgi:ADP-ribosyl-[dinitrogen reductase] hydrolase